MTDGRVCFIVAMAENRVIGRNGGIPWDLPEDRQHFRELTWGHPVIMGRKTFESIGHPLPGRENIVLSRQREYRPEGCLVAPDLGSALDACPGSGEVFICGGAEVFREALPQADRIYLTMGHIQVEGDAFFPDLPAGEFAEIERRAVPTGIPCEFIVYERVAPSCRCG